jgi:uncharacterized protein with PIN domain
MPARPTHVIDACALIAYLGQEDGHEAFAALLADDQNVLAIHATNLCEVYYGYLRSDGIEKAQEAWQKAISILGVIEKMDTQFMSASHVGRSTITCR